MQDSQQPAPSSLNYQPYPKKIIPLTGKWIPANEGTDLGENFKELTNMRYTNTHPVGILGMTKVNSATMNDTYYRPRAAYHYMKSQPAESHLMVQAYNSGLSGSAILDNKTAIPGAGEFESTSLWTDSAGAGRGVFSIAPDEMLVYCNGVENLIWGGAESRIGGFFIANPDSQIIYDYTERVQNTMTDSENVATMVTMGGGIDTYTKVLLHGENVATDSSGNSHTYTLSTVTYSSAIAKFGTYSFSFNGTSSYAYCADHADFDCSGGIWSVDMWVYFNSFNAISTLWAQATDANNYHRLYVNTSGIVIYNLMTASVEKSTIASGIGSVVVGRWHHIEMTENGNSYYLYIDGSLVSSMSAADRPANYTSHLTLGAFYNASTWASYLPGYVDEFRFSKGAARHVAAFTPQVSAYSSSAASTLYVVSPRALSGIYLYVKTANTSVAAVASDYWTGSGYSLTAAPIDYMEYGSDALAQAAYITNDPTTATTIDYMEYSTSTLAQAAYVTSAGGVGMTEVDYMEYATDAAVQAGYASDAGYGSATHLLHLDGSNGSSVFIDEFGSAWSTNGSALLTTTNPKFGTACLGLNGTSQSLYRIESIVSRAWTAELWFRTSDKTQQNQAIWSNTATSNNYGIAVMFNYSSGTAGRLALFVSSAAVSWNISDGISTGVGSRSTYANDTWYKIAIQWTGAAYEVYIGEAGSPTTKDISVSSSVAHYVAATTYVMLSQLGAVGYYLKGAVDEYRQTLGTAVYTGVFTPETAPLNRSLQSFSESATKSQGSYSLKGVAAGGTYVSDYPPAQSATYVKATTTYAGAYYPYQATNPVQSLTGDAVDDEWASNSATNQRFHIDLGSPKVINRIYYENSHSSGLYSNQGAKNFTLWGSNTAASFAELTYATDTGWTQLTTSASQFDQHTASDIADPKYITVTNTTAYRYYAFKFADNWGGSGYLGFRRIELQEYPAYYKTLTRDVPQTLDGTGGVITHIGGYTVHTFRTSGTFNPGIARDVEYLVVGGGGGGGKGVAAGGGAGGYRCSVTGELTGGGGAAESVINITGNTTVTVGAGGAGQTISGTGGASGGDSVFGSITATGGGGAGGLGLAAGKTGGCGGGSMASTTGASGTYGYKGGDGATWGSGGGGGAGAVGTNCVNLQNGPGGAGLSSSITGISVTRAGGGGAGGYAPQARGVGGTGGGGAGAFGAGAPVGTAGTVNTGGGGGGGGADNGNGGAGGSGIVIVRYLTQYLDLTDKTTSSFDLRSSRTGSNIKVGLRQRYNPLDTNTKLLMHMDGADSGVLFYDETGRTVTVGGNACTKTAQYKFGVSSAYFDGTGDYVTVPDSDDWYFGTGNFTIDCWVKLNSVLTSTETFIAQWNNDSTPSTVAWALVKGNATIQFWYYASGTVSPSWSYTWTTAWTHVAIVRNGTLITCYINGVSVGVYSIGSASINDASSVVYLGTMAAAQNAFTGYIDEVRITKGLALWTDNFTPPTSAMTLEDWYTKLLIHFDGTDAATSYTAESGQALTFTGTAQLDTAQKKFGTASLLLDGNSDYVSIPDSDDWYFGTGNFTIDFWVRFNAFTCNDSNFHLQGTITGGNTLLLQYRHSTTKLQFEDYPGSNNISVDWTWAPSTGQWYHVALVRDGTGTYCIKAYINGTSLGNGNLTAGSWAASLTNYSSGVYIGRYNASYLDGWIDEYRISKGIARWTADFTVPAYAYNSTALIETTPTISSAGAFETKSWDLASVANADKNNIDQIILTIVDAAADNTFYLDNFYAGLPPVLNAYSESTYKQQGSYSLKAIAEITTSANETLTRTIGSPIDLTGIQTLFFDVRASRVGVNFTLSIRDSGGTWTSISPNVFYADTWQTITWDVSSVADADKNAIDRIRLTIDNATAANTIYLDNFYAAAVVSSLQSYSEGTIVSQGSYSLKGIALQTRSLSKTLTHSLLSTVDLTGVSSIGFAIYASRTGSNIKVGIRDSGGTWTENTPNVAVADTWQSVVWDISGVSDANKNAIDQIKITVENADADNTFYIDALGPAGGALYDGTATVGGTKTLGQSGLISFGSTTTLAKPKMYNGLVGYLYRFTFTGIDAAVTISHATVAAPMQPLVDLWDGVDRECMAFYVYKNSTYNDYTLNVYENDYDATDVGSFVELDSLAAGTNKLYFATYERLMGINFGLIGGHVNTTASTVMTIKYSSNGMDFTTVGTIDDGTAQSGISFSKSGTVTWSPPAAALEFMSKVSKATPRYHYEISFSQAFSSDVQLFYASGIPVQKTFGQYKFPLMAQDMLFLCCDTSGKKNAAIHSEYQTAQIFNGTNAGVVEFGESGELTCGASLYNLYGYNLYNLIIFFKDAEMWKLSGNFPDWRRHLVSDAIGCPAPATLKTITLPGDVPQGLSRNIIIWQGSQGVYVSDGRAALPISGDIENYFDATKVEHINASLLGDSWADIDMNKMEYHLHIASGSAATGINTELVFDLQRWRWYKTDRGTGKQLVCGASVRDTDGNYYNYGFIDTGFMERLEYGTTFDGNDIVHAFQTGDMVLDQNDFTMETQVERIQLITVAKTVTSNDITYTHYVDTESVGVNYTMSPTATGKRVANIVTPINSKVGTFHGGKFVMTTDDETIGFEPLALAYIYSLKYETVITF